MKNKNSELIVIQQINPVSILPDEINPIPQDFKRERIERWNRKHNK